MNLQSVKYLLLIVAVGSFASCRKAPEKREGKLLAKVYDKYLYSDDLKGVIPAEISDSDSASLSRDFIEKWIRNELLLNKAEMNLSDEEKDVEQQINNYRSSLLIYAYQQRYLGQNLDTVVTDQEIEAYFKDNQSNFMLGEPLMKGFFIKVPASAPDINKLRQWYRADDKETINKLEGYCFAHAAVYDHFNDDWVNQNEVLRMIPGNGDSFRSTLGYRNYLEVKDNNFYYFLYVKETAAEGSVSPFELVRDDIHYIILNKRKVKLIDELERNIFSDAQNREQFIIYQ
jgi:hypothetical protein